MTAEKKKSPCQTSDKDSCHCNVVSIISVDERGQMVLPKDLRKCADINAGDKLAVVSWFKDGKVCCITLMKAEELTGMVKETLGPIMKEVL